MLDKTAFFCYILDTNIPLTDYPRDAMPQRYAGKTSRTLSTSVLSVSIENLPAQLLSANRYQISDTLLKVMAGDRPRELMVAIFRTDDGLLTWRGIGQCAPRATFIGMAKIVCRQEDASYCPVAVIVEGSLACAYWSSSWEPNMVIATKDIALFERP